MNYYRRFPGDYARDTMSLNLLQHGAYTLLLDHLYSTEKRIETEEEARRICRANTQEERWAVAEILKNFFKKTTRGFTQKRFEQVIKEQRNWRKRQKRKRLKERDISVTVTPESRALSTLHSPLPLKDKTLKAFPQPGFEVFWEAYPKKVAKQDARKAWAKTGAEDHLGEVLASVADWKKCPQWQDFEFIPYPATFLNQERWKEAVPRPEAKAAGLQSQYDALMEKSHGNVAGRSA